MTDHWPNSIAEGRETIIRLRTHIAELERHLDSYMASGQSARARIAELETELVNHLKAAEVVHRCNLEAFAALRAENEGLREGIARIDRYVDMNSSVHRMIRALLSATGESKTPERGVSFFTEGVMQGRLDAKKSENKP